MAYPVVIDSPNSFKPEIATLEKSDDLKEASKQRRQQASISLVGEGGGGRTVLTPSRQTLEKPPGITRLVLIAGDHVSATFNNGDSTAQEKREEAEKQLRTKPFTFAPGDDDVSVGWKVSNPASIESVKFELFCRTKEGPVGSAEWTGDELKRLTGGENATAKVIGSVTFTSGLLKLDDVLFPDGVPTVEHSPYQLRLTVTPKAGAKVYPATAWTHFHVAVHSVALEWGDEGWLADARTDVEDPRKAALEAAEKKVLGELARRRVGDADLPVNLPGNFVTGDGAKDLLGADLKAAYGAGLRIPLKAVVQLAKADGSPSAKAAKKALGQASLLWDWEDPKPGKVDAWLAVRPHTTLLSQRTFRKLLDKEVGTPGVDFPARSTNAPVALGGKRGKDALPVFPEQRAGGAFPYEVKPAAGTKRPWASVSKCGTGPSAGTSGAVFQPPLTLGDTLQVNVWVVSGGEDLTQRADTADETLRELLAKEGATVPHAKSGAFEVRRTVDLHYYAFPRHDADLLRAATEYFRDVAATDFAVDLKTTLPAFFTDPVKVKAEVDTAVGKNQYGFVRDHVLDLPFKAANAEQALVSRDFDGYRAHVISRFKLPGAVQALELDADHTKNAKGKSVLPEVATDAGKIGWLLGVSPGIARTYYVLLANPAQPFAKDDVLKIARDNKTTKVVRVVSTTSAWDSEVVVSMNPILDPKGKETDVAVDVAGTVVNLKFPTKGLRRKVSRSVTTTDRTALVNAYVLAAKASNGAAPLRVRITGVGRDARSVQRLENVAAVFRQCVADDVVVDTRHVFNQLATIREAALGAEWQFPLASNSFSLGSEFAKQAFVQDALVGDGVHYFAFGPFSKASFVPGGAIFSALPSLWHKNIGYHNAPAVSPSVKQQVLPNLVLLVHELAHALHRPGHARRQLWDAQENGESDTSHVMHDTCIMNYDTDPTSTAFCAACMARMRGWLMKLPDREVDETVGASTLEEEAKKGGEHAEWRWMRLAYLRATQSEVTNAQKEFDKKITQARNTAQDNYRKSDKAKKLKQQIDTEKEKGASGKARAAKLQAQKDQEEGGLMAQAEAKTRADELPNLRSKFGPVVEAARKAWSVFEANGGVPGSRLGVTMLRNLIIAEARYGEARHAVDLWHALKKITQAPYDLELSGPQVWVEPLLLSAGADEYRFKLEVGDPAQVFGDATSEEGKKQRLQALGLFPVPIDHPRAADALRVGWDTAKRLVPGLEGDPTKLDEELQRFLVSTPDGTLPADGAFAKLRLPPHTPGLYSNHMLQFMFPEREFPASGGFQEGVSPEESPYAGYMIGAQEKNEAGEIVERTRRRIEQDYLTANPTLGKIPLRIKVERRTLGSTKDTDWVPSMSPLVRLELVKPDDLPAWNEGQNWGTNDVGHVAKSFHKGATPPALDQPVKDLFDNTVAKYEPGDEDDPQACNAHANLGGKRGLSSDGRIGVAMKDPRRQTVIQTNLFCQPRALGFANVEPEGKREFDANAIEVRGDDKGVAHVVFAPSLVAGDRYKLRVTMAPLGEASPPGEATSGTLVTWRSLRISRLVRQEVHTATTELTPSIRALAASPLAPPEMKQPKALAAVDFTAYPAKEFAKAYTEMLFDPRALTPVSPASFEASFLREAKALIAKYPVANRPEAGKTGKGKNRSRTVPITKVPLLPVGESKKKFAVELGCKVDAGSLSVRSKGGTAEDAVCDDLGAAVKNPPAKFDFSSKKGPPISAGHVVYASGHVEVEFTLDQTGAFEVAFFPDDAIDVDALLEFPTKSPYLFNLKSPEAYNTAIRGRHYLPMDGHATDEWGKAVSGWGKGFIDDRSNGLVKALFLQAFARAIDDCEGVSPGLNLVQAAVIEPWCTTFRSVAQEGKAVGQTVYLLGGDDRTALHEMAHGIYFEHAPLGDAAGAKPHLHKDGCVMGYLSQHRSFCALCNASLRGMAIDDEPFAA